MLARGRCKISMQYNCKNNEKAWMEICFDYELDYGATWGSVDKWRHIKQAVVFQFHVEW